MQRSKFPEMLLVNVDADSVKSDAKVKRDWQHRQAMFAPQMDIGVKHTRPQRRSFVRRFDLNMYESQPLIQLADSLTWNGLACRQFTHQVEHLPLSCRRVRKNLLVQPLHGRGIQPFCPGTEEEKQKLLEELL